MFHATRCRKGDCISLGIETWCLMWRYWLDSSVAKGIASRLGLKQASGTCSDEDVKRRKGDCISLGIETMNVMS